MFFRSIFTIEHCVKIFENSHHIRNVHAHAVFFFASACANHFGCHHSVLNISVVNSSCFFFHKHVAVDTHVISMSCERTYKLVGFSVSRENNTKDRSNWIRNESGATPYCFFFVAYFLCFHHRSSFHISHVELCRFSCSSPVAHSHFTFSPFGFAVLYLFTLIVAISDAVFIYPKTWSGDRHFDWTARNVHMCLLSIDYGKIFTILLCKAIIIQRLNSICVRRNFFFSHELEFSLKRIDDIATHIHPKNSFLYTYSSFTCKCRFCFLCQTDATV